jgi:hypothetical protein
MLASVLALSAVAYEVGRERKFPDWPVPFDLNEHASHPGPGIIIGYTCRTFADKVRHLKQIPMIAPVIGSTLAGTLFEFEGDHFWYRHNTFSLVDMAYTTLGGVIGGLCVRNAQSRDAVEQT